MAKPLERLKAFFGISTKTNGTMQTIVPGRWDAESEKVAPVKFNDEIQRLLDFWFRDSLDSSKTIRHREGRIKELSYAYYNSSIFSTAVRLYSDEALQADSENQILKVYAKDRALEKYIYEFFDKIGMDEALLKEIAFNLALYGDSFCILDSEEKTGIKKALPIDIMAVKERIEFNALKVAKELPMGTINNLKAKNSRYAALVDLYDTMKDTDFTQYFRTFLFGYQIQESFLVPPWNVLHFRIISHASEFYPYGRPILINCLSPFKQLQSAVNLMAIARASNFPLKHFKVKTADSMSQMDQWNAVNKAREQFQNLMGSNNREQFSAASEFWTPAELLEIVVEDVSVDTDKIADVEFLRNELADGTGIPLDYISSTTSNWGNSGNSLLQQSKIFARSVFTLQTAIIDALVDLVKTHLVMTGDFPLDAEFELSLNYPVMEEDDDKRRAKTDSLELAKSVLTTFGELFGITDGPLPTEIVRDVLTKLSFLDGEDIDAYIKEIEKLRAEMEKEQEVSGGDEYSDADFEEEIEEVKRLHRLKEMRSRITDDRVREVYFINKKSKRMVEGVMGKRHYKASFTTNDMIQHLSKVFENKDSGKLID